jgi:hypothetical protein
MIEKDAMLTTIGVVLLAISYGFSLTYIQDMRTGNDRYGFVLPFGLNIAVMVYIAYGLFTVSKVSNDVKIVILGVLALLYTFELTLMYEKPTSWYGIPTSFVFINLGTLVRLYLIISLHNDLPKTFFVTAAKAIIEPVKGPEPRMDRNEPNWDKAYSAFEGVLRKLDLTPDEKTEQINKFRAAWGKGPKDVSMKGGKR